MGGYPHRHEGYTLTGEKMKEIQAVNASAAMLWPTA